MRESRVISSQFSRIERDKGALSDYLYGMKRLIGNEAIAMLTLE